MDEFAVGHGLIYPQLLATLTEADLASQLPVGAGREGVGGNGGRGGAVDGRIADPAEGISEYRSPSCPSRRYRQQPCLHCEATFSLAAPTDVSIDPRTTYRPKQCHSHLLGCYAVGCKRPSRRFEAVAVAAETRLDPAELVNAAIDALIRKRCELHTHCRHCLRLAGNAPPPNQFHSMAASA